MWQIFLFGGLCSNLKRLYGLYSYIVSHTPVLFPILTSLKVCHLSDLEKVLSDLHLGVEKVSWKKLAWFVMNRCLFVPSWIHL